MMRAGLLAAGLCCLAFASHAGPPQTSSSRPVQHEAAVASAHPLATEAGMAVLRAGGNAFDAAVAVTTALGVVEPSGSGLGGGGFYLLHRARDGRQIMLDARETAPLAAHERMYLEAGEGRSLDGPLAAGIPGIPAALEHLTRRYGRLSLERNLAAAIRHAKEGFTVDDHYRRYLGFRRDVVAASPAAAAVFLKQGDVPEEGDLILQPDLAATLETLARQGGKGFYRGPVAQTLVRGVREAGGIWTEQDLARYRVIERRPITVEHRGHRIVSAAPPSAGGIALATIFHQLRALPRSEDQAGRIHVLAETMRRAYRDRTLWLGDPDFAPIPVRRLTDPAYGASLARDIHPAKATPSASLGPAPEIREGFSTTHFSILDAEGNRVAATLSINYPFGSGFMPEGTGVLLNNEMDDFATRPGQANVYGLVGGRANVVAPGKRMLSSMSPTFVEGPRGVAILGTPGGSRIITMVLLAALDYMDGGSALSMVRLPRFHHQYLPDVIQYEEGTLSEALMQRLEAMGHALKSVPVGFYGNMQVVAWDRKTNRVTTGVDPRGGGAGAVETIGVSQR